MPTATSLRRAVAGLATLAADDLAAMWAGMDSPRDAEAVLGDSLGPLIESYGAAAATVSADWYDESRDEAGVARRFTAIPAEIADVGADALVGWAVASAQDFTGFQTLVAGGAQRRIVNFSRLTVSQSAVADPGARGWKRVGAGGCAFCRLLIGRGAVYSEATADFKSHDHCNCAAVPAWR